MTSGLTGTSILTLVHLIIGIHIGLDDGDGIVTIRTIVIFTYGIDLLWLI